VVFNQGCQFIEKVIPVPQTRTLCRTFKNSLQSNEKCFHKSALLQTRLFKVLPLTNKHLCFISPGNNLVLNKPGTLMTKITQWNICKEQLFAKFCLIFNGVY
jgi:hypothetical protein